MPARLRPGRILLALALSLLSAAMFTLAFPPYRLWPLIFIGLVPMVVAQHRMLPSSLTGLAVGLGIGGFFAGYFGTMFANGPWFMRILPFFIVIIASLIGTRDRAFHQRTAYRRFVLHGAVTWVSIEMIRGQIPVLGTWGFVAYALYAQPWLIQLVSLFGVYGLSFLIVLTNYAVALITLTFIDRCWRPEPDLQPTRQRHAWRWLCVVGCILLAWVGLSLMQLSHPPTMARVAAIQPGFRIGSTEGLQRLFDLARRAADQDAELIVWPEGTLSFAPRTAHTEAIRSLSMETGAHFVIGYTSHEEAGPRNEAVILTPAGTFLGPYGKDHPVAWSGETSITRGPYAAYHTALGTLGMMICYDLDFTDTARRITRAGAQLLAVLSLDWPAVAEKHSTHLIFRAVENRLTTIKADVAFDSAIIDPYGRILTQTSSRTPEQAILIIADVPLGSGRTPATLLGDWVG